MIGWAGAALRVDAAGRAASAARSPIRRRRGCCVLVSPATWHNARVGGDFVLVSYAGGMNLFIGNNPDARGEFNVPRIVPSALADDPEEQRVVFQALARARQRSRARAVGGVGLLGGRALAYVREQPADGLRLMLRKVAALLQRLRAVERALADADTRVLGGAAPAAARLRRAGALRCARVVGDAPRLACAGAALRLARHGLDARCGSSSCCRATASRRCRCSCCSQRRACCASSTSLRARRWRALAGARCSRSPASRSPCTGRLRRENLGDRVLQPRAIACARRARPSARSRPISESTRRSPRYLSAFNNLALAYEDAGRREDARDGLDATLLALAQAPGLRAPRRARRAASASAGGSCRPRVSSGQDPAASAAACARSRMVRLIGRCGFSSSGAREGALGICRSPDLQQRAPELEVGVLVIRLERDGLRSSAAAACSQSPRPRVQQRDALPGAGLRLQGQRALVLAQRARGIAAALEPARQRDAPARAVAAHAAQPLEPRAHAAPVALGLRAAHAHVGLRSRRRAAARGSSAPSAQTARRERAERAARDRRERLRASAAGCARRGRRAASRPRRRARSGAGSRPRRPARARPPS